MMKELAGYPDVLDLPGVRAAIHDMTPRGCPHIGKWMMIGDDEEPTDLRSCLHQLRDPDVLGGIALGVVASCPLNFWSPGDLLGACCRSLIGGVVFRSLSRLAIRARLVAAGPTSAVPSPLPPDTLIGKEDDDDTASIPVAGPPRAPVGTERQHQQRNRRR